MMSEKKIALYAGSFDPVTLGHLDIMKRAADVFDEVYVGLFVNTTKKSWFTVDEKEQLILENLADCPNVKVVKNSLKLTVDVAKELGANFLIRGVRNVRDFEYEKEIARLNHELSGIETVLLFSDAKYEHMSSSMIKEIFTFNGDISLYVPDNVLTMMKEKRSHE
jgi:pantetheine-phosphate adenylyltransferase